MRRFSDAPANRFASRYGSSATRPWRPQPFCSADPTSPDYCFNKIVIRTQAQAPNSGETEPEEDSVGSLPGPDLLVEGTVDGTPFEAGLSGDPETASSSFGFVDVGSLTIRNAGTASTSDFSYASYLRAPPGIALLKSGLFGGTGGLAPDGTIVTGPFRVYTIFDGIDGPTPVAEGSYVVGLFADDGGQVNETNETNNQLESADSITVGDQTLTFTYSNFVQGVPEGVNVTPHCRWCSRGKAQS